ncbi:putative F-box/kelch-repeat protein [Abeliophyllum distichum]|uniref:F-box/kelch-repeat protein n=1 Tax=Abeliophyllum distichum TaxID=126358 RepID=A0ABD1Q6Z4_9LAMI
MGELYDDLVLEVISWLPLKDAIQCKILNKNFSTHISSQSFEHKHFVQSNQKNCNLLYRSYSGTQIFRQLRLDHPHPLNNSEIITICAGQITNSVSCGGLVILRSTYCFDPDRFRSYFLLNPITGEYLCLKGLDQHDGWNVGAFGLAVDSRNLSYRYIVVLVYVKKHKTCSKNQVCKFITFTSCSSKWEESNEEDFVCELSEFLKTNIQPVYLNDTLHWLREDGSILAYNVEKSRTRIIQGPVKLISGKWFGYEIWFGGVEGLGRISGEKPPGLMTVQLGGFEGGGVGVMGFFFQIQVWMIVRLILLKRLRLSQSYTPRIRIRTLYQEESMIPGDRTNTMRSHGKV